MKALVISDVHSNLPALLAVFRATRRKRIDLLICLGDLVGYGAHPNQVLEEIRRHRARKLIVRGNHDRIASGAGGPEGFNQPARQAALWTRTRLTPGNRKFLANVPVGPIEAAGVTICHGSILDEDEYLFSTTAAAESFDAMNGDLGLFGHTHLPSLFRRTPAGVVTGMITSARLIRLDRESRYLANPGSVGQPRDRDPRAGYALLDLERRTVAFRRIEYDVVAAQRAIRGAGLPDILADRLAAGF